MQYSLEHFAVCVAAITGVLAARGKQVDLFGVLVLAFVTAFGGGTIRNVLHAWHRSPRLTPQSTRLARCASHRCNDGRDDRCGWWHLATC